MTNPRTCHFGCGPAVAILTYMLPNSTKRRHYAVCLHHYTEFSRDNLVQARYCKQEAGS